MAFHNTQIAFNLLENQKNIYQVYINVKLSLLLQEKNAWSLGEVFQ